MSPHARFARLRRGGSSPLAQRLLYGAVCLYILLPFAIFCFGWLKWFIALPMVGLLCASLVLMVRHAPPLWLPELDRRTLLKIGLVALLVFLWVWYSGIGRFSWQTEDHAIRNSLFRMLVEERWPIVEAAPPAELFDGPVAFVYYFGFWLPSALVGKVFGLSAGHLAQVVWAWLGILAFYWLVLAAGPKKMVVWPLVLFVLFSGMDWIGASILAGQPLNVITATPHLDNWPDYFQLSSFTTQLYWVYNQAIPGWVATVLLYVQRDNRCLALIAAATLISGTLPAVGLVPIGLYIAWRNQRQAAPGAPFSLAGFFRGILTVENGTGLLCAIVSLLFLGSNNNGQNFGGLFHVFGTVLPLWLLFIACEVAVLLALMAKYQWKNPLFWLISALFVLLPWVRINDKADFGMRATIPALVILYLMVVDALGKSAREKNKALFAGLLAALILGTATAETEIVRSVAMTHEMKRVGPVVTEEWSPMEVVWRDNFYGYTEGRLFFSYLMRAP